MARSVPPVVLALPVLAGLAVLVAVSVVVPTRDASAQTPPGSITALVREVATGYAQRAAEAERAGRMLEAEVLYLRALETDPGLLAAHLGYARALDARQHRDEARRVLENLPRRAFDHDAEAVEVARAFIALGATDQALDLLRVRNESVEALRALVTLASTAGRFPEALAAARRLAELARDPESARSAQLLVRALSQVVGEVDAVQCAFPNETALRRLLRDG